jgi:hypothetical protein
MPQGIVKPANQVLVLDLGCRVVDMEIGAAATAAQMVPGRCVIFDGADQTVKEAGAKARNVVGVLEAAPGMKVTDAYARGDIAKVIIGKFLGAITLLASENVTRGDGLVSAANGKFAKQAVGAMGAQGAVIGKTYESSNVTVDATILAELDTTNCDAAAVS